MQPHDRRSPYGQKDLGRGERSPVHGWLGGRKYANEEDRGRYGAVAAGLEQTCHNDNSNIVGVGDTARLDDFKEDS